jgi:photosystem II stability/assembly factor-like uncharacterized protein
MTGIGTAGSRKLELREQYVKGETCAVESSEETSLDVNISIAARGMNQTQSTSYKRTQQYSQKILAVDKNGAPTKISRTYGKDKIKSQDSAGDGSGSDKPDSLEGNTYIIKKKGDGVEVEKEGGSVTESEKRDLQNALKGKFASLFPEKPVRKGKSWDIEQEALRDLLCSSPQMQKMEAEFEGTAKAKYAKNKKYGKYQSAVVELKIDVKIKGESNAPGYKGDGRLYFALEEKKVVGVDLDIKLKISGSSSSQYGQVTFNGGGSLKNTYKANLGGGEGIASASKQETDNKKNKAVSSKWKSTKGPVKTDLRSVYFADDKTAFATGDDGTVLVSRDGGKKWEKIEVQSEATLRGVHFTDAKHGWICGDGDPDAPRPRGHVVTGLPMKCGTCLITKDGGKTWERVWVQTNFELRSIWMASEKVGQICNHGTENHADGDKIVTDDGGKNWEQKRVYRGLNDCCWVSEKEGWAVGSRVSVGFMGGRGPTSPLLKNKNARIIHTTDGGRTWEPVDAPDIGGMNQLRSVWFVDRKFGCAVGDDGSILVTSDGGKNWKQRRKITDSALNAVCFTDSRNGWVVGEDGTMLKTQDGGKNWKVENSPTKETLYGLHFNEKGKAGIAVGEKGTIIRLSSQGAASSWR